MGKGQRRVIPLQLDHALDMFERPQADLFSEYRNFLTGADYCISELRSHRDRGPVRLEISRPDSEADDAMADRIGRTMRPYCAHRIQYNQQAAGAAGHPDRRRRRAVDRHPDRRHRDARRHLGARWTNASDNGGLVLNTGGWVLAWIGLWFPLDSMLFTPLGYGRENRVPRLLGDAEVAVRPRPTVSGRLP
jgi:hypothetical protein